MRRAVIPYKNKLNPQSCGNDKELRVSKKPIFIN